MSASATPEDVKAWTGFVDAADKCARSHLTYIPTQAAPVADKLFAAEKRVRRKTMPWGQAVVGSPLFRLWTLSRDWRANPLEQRRETAQQMADLVAAVRGAMGADQAQPQRRERRDIDG